MKVNKTDTRASLVEAILSRSWRASFADAPKLSEAQLDEVTPLLYGSGAAALGWWRLQDTALRDSASAEVLHQAYRLQLLQSGIHEENIKTVFRLLRAAGIEPILVKGWAAASLYPDRALRPYGDIDVCVRPADFKEATARLAAPEASSCWTDLHRGFSEIKNRSFDQLFTRSRLVTIGEEQIRVLAAEDHLALLSIHLLKHGAWRPVWLCDVAAAVESHTSGFDWDICLGTDQKRACWIACAVGLAHRLLGADLDQQPAIIRDHSVPAWLIASVRKQWEQPFAINQPPMSHPLPILEQLRQPQGIWRALQARWPNPILATISVNGKLNSAPRWPYQIGNLLARVAHVLIHPRAVHD